MNQTERIISYSLDHILTTCRGAGVLRLKPRDIHARTIILLHGLEASKERSLTTMYAFAQAGFDVVAIDLYMHGDRPDAASRNEKLEHDFIGAMRDIIYESAKDVIAIVNELGIDFTKAGLFGISAGGFTGHVIATGKPVPKAYVAAITSPDWVTINPETTKQMPGPLKALLHSLSPIGNAKHYAPIALLQLHGLLDQRVYPAGAIELHKRLAPIYQSANISERLEIKTYADVDHDLTEPMIQEAIRWFDKFLE